MLGRIMRSPKLRINVSDRSKKRFIIALGIAVLMHLPVTPMLPLMRMVHRIAVRNREVTPPKPAAPLEVEVELQQAAQVEERRQQKAEAAEAQRDEATSSHQAALPDKPAAPLPFAQAKPPPPAEEPAVDPAKEEKKKKLHDLGLEGAEAKKDEVRPGVTLGLWLSQLRDNPLGKEIVDIASCDRQWRTFSQQGIDLLNDFEGVLIVGPSLFEPGQMTAAVRHSLAKERVYAVVDGLVQKSGNKGRWVKPNVAQVRIGRESHVLMPQQDDLFFVAPAKGWEALHRAKQGMKVPKSEGRLASVVLTKPNQVLKRVGLSLPARIVSLRLEVFVYADQSGELKLELEDTSSTAAGEDLREVSNELSDFFADAWLLTSTLSSFTGAEQVTTGPEAAPKLELATQENNIAGSARLSVGQTRTTLNLIRSLMCRKPKLPTNTGSGAGNLAAKAK